MSSSDDSSSTELLSNLKNVRKKRATSPSSIKLKKEAKARRNIKGDRHRQQSGPYFVDRWLDRFKPWLARDKVDPEKPFCKACRCRVSCNKIFHLKRHEETTKHQTNLISYLNAKGIPHLLQCKEREQKTHKVQTKTSTDDSQFESVLMDIHILDKEKERLKNLSTQETIPNFQTTKCENADGNESKPSPIHIDSIPPQNDQLSPFGRECNENEKRLLSEIQGVKNEIISSINELFSKASFDKERNHIDLFFDSVSSSIKTFPPKLVAESKMRFSQLVCEMELRAITESESNATAESLVLEKEPIVNAYIIDNGGATANGHNQVVSSQLNASYRAKD